MKHVSRDARAVVLGLCGFMLAAAVFVETAPEIGVCESAAQKAVDGDGALSGAVVCVAVASGKSVSARFDTAAWDAAVWD